MSETDDQTYLKVWLEVANSKHINRKTLSVTIAVSFLIWTDMTPFQTFKQYSTPYPYYLKVSQV